MLVTLLLEYCIQFGATQYNNIKILQCDQGKAKNVLKGLDGMTYEEQLRIICFFQFREEEAEGQSLSTNSS